MTQPQIQPRLIAIRGIPGCGKTTLAEHLVGEAPDRTVMVSRDDLRVLLHGRRLGTAAQEKQVTQAEHVLIATMLRAGNDVVVHDMNLETEFVAALQETAFDCGALFGIVDMTDVPLATCLEQNRARLALGGRFVPPEVIEKLHAAHVAGRGHPLPRPEIVPVRPYMDPGPGQPWVTLVDIDGTVALRGDRSPYDETRVLGDEPNQPVLDAVVERREAGDLIVFMSGRSEKCRPDTEKWLSVNYGTDYELLLMRPAGDGRRDSVVKQELFDRHIRRHYRVRYVFDDRDQVVRMWRRLGLTVFQVADGAF